MLRPKQIELEGVSKQPACLVGIEACASAHYWARELSRLGHQVKLMPPSYVKPYLKRQKNDAADADAEAICEAVTRPTMRFVEVKSPEQQSVMVLHRVRMMLMRQRVQLSNAIRGHMAEFGLVAPIGREGLHGLISLLDAADAHVLEEAATCLQMLAGQLRLVDYGGDCIRMTIDTRRLDPEGDAPRRKGRLSTLQPGPIQMVTVPMKARLASGGVEVMTTPQRAAPDERALDRPLIAAVVRAQSWRCQIEGGFVQTVAKLAKREGMKRDEFDRLLSLAYLAPDITEAILNGRQGAAVTLKCLIGSELSRSWNDQHSTV